MPSPTLGSLGPSHHRRHKSQVSLRGPPCAHGVSSIPLERCATTCPSPPARRLLFWRWSKRSPASKRSPCSVMTLMMMCHLPLTLPHLPHHHRRISPSSILS